MELYDTIVIGGGPAGVSAAIYTARKMLKTLLITETFKGQSSGSKDIQNWIGEKHISGVQLAQKLEEHIKGYPQTATIRTHEKVVSVRSVASQEADRVCDFEVLTDKNTTYGSKTIIATTGARRRRLGIPGEDRLESKGVSFCATCDAPTSLNKTIAVIGGGNAGLEVVHDLFPYAKEIYVLDFGSELKGDPIRIEEIKKNPKLKEVILNAQVLEILGDDLVCGIRFNNMATNEEKTLGIQGVFIEIGSVPNSEIVKDLVQLNEHNEIIINPTYARTSHPGIFAAGDVTSEPFKQNNIAAGDGIKAALAAYAYLLNLEKHNSV